MAPTRRPTRGGRKVTARKTTTRPRTPKAEPVAAEPVRRRRRSTNGHTQVTFSDIRKVLGAQQGDEVIGLMKAAMFKPITVTDGNLDAALAMAQGTRGGIGALPALRRYFQDRPAEALRFGRWAEEFRASGLTS